ncbi:MAG TPA: peptidylprolyl isomerase [Acidimicrobiales bacterium]|nr:peptidylprolyl isomerase [Acidimicrobiales bacterium]
MPSDKRARQRAAREARLAAEAKAQKRRRQIRNGIIVVIVAGAVIGIVFAVSGNNPKTVGSQSSTSTTLVTPKAKENATLQKQANEAAVKAGCPTSPTTPANHQTYTTAPPMTIDTSKSYSATVVTTAGTFDIALNAKAAPQTVNNFVFLADKGYYRCNSFFRVIPQFINQSGNATQTNAATSALSYTLPAENLPPAGTATSPAYPAGAVAMATSSKGVSGNQFFIVAGAQGESLSSTYPLFGLVTSGMNVVQTINQQGSASGVPPDVTQRILSVTIHES